MRIAVEGCAHGELEIIYDTIQFIETRDGIKVDLLLCCGDFQSTRNYNDLNSMAVPDKYKDMCTFYKYYSGEKVAPVLTIFIGGNHEASSYLHELPYGGWVAPNIYYLGLSGVVNYNGIRIAGLSGIYKSNDYMIGRHERPPYNNQSMRSIYHIRNLDVFRLKQLKRPIDVFLTHDWPRGIHKFGDTRNLLKFKAHLREDIESNQLGSEPAEELLNELKPSYWFSAHLHCKFSAVVHHQDEERCKTKFLALDKCLPKRKFLQILEIKGKDDSGDYKLEYDEEWLSILHFTNHLISYKKDTNILPNKQFEQDGVRWNFSPSQVELEFIRAKMSNNLVVPDNFVATAPSYVPGQRAGPAPPLVPNPQTQTFCQTLGISDMYEEVLGLEPLPRYSGSPANPRFSSFVESNDSSDDDQDPTNLTPPTTREGLSSSSELDICSPLRQTLSLPPPKNTQVDEPSSPDNRVSTSPNSNDVTSDTSPFIIDTSPTSTPLTHKKFKRRNQDLYQESQDE